MLPATRNRTYSASSPVASTDLNEIQDCIIGWKHAAATRNTVPIVLAIGGWTYSTTADPSIVSTASPASAFLEIESYVGDNITSVFIYGKGNGTVDCTFDLIMRAADGTLTTLGTATDTNHNTTLSAVNIGVTQHTFLPGEVLFLKATANAAGYFVYTIATTRERL